MCSSEMEWRGEERGWVQIKSALGCVSIAVLPEHFTYYELLEIILYNGVGISHGDHTIVCHILYRKATPGCHMCIT